MSSCHHDWIVTRWQQWFSMTIWHLSPSTVTNGNIMWVTVTHHCLFQYRMVTHIDNQWHSDTIEFVTWQLGYCQLQPVTSLSPGDWGKQLYLKFRRLTNGSLSWCYIDSWWIFMIFLTVIFTNIYIFPVFYYIRDFFPCVPALPFGETVNSKIVSLTSNIVAIIAAEA